MAISKRMRYEILRRDNYTCRYCRSVENELTIDHVLPVSLGGQDEPENLVAACRDCNAGKSSTSPTDDLVADVKQEALRWGRAIAEWNAINHAATADREAWVAIFDNEWKTWTRGVDDEHFPRPTDWRESARQFYATGLPVDEAIEAIDIACGSTKVHADNAWRYMCGVIWRKVEQMHEGARDLIAEQETRD